MLNEKLSQEAALLACLSISKSLAKSHSLYSCVATHLAKVLSSYFATLQQTSQISLFISNSSLFSPSHKHVGPTLSSSSSPIPIDGCSPIPIHGCPRMKPHLRHTTPFCSGVPPPCWTHDSSSRGPTRRAVAPSIGST